MKRAFKILLAIFAALVLLLVGVYTYLGGFHNVVIEEKSTGPFHFAYREMKGADFSKIGDITTTLERELRGKGFRALQPFDLFFSEGGGEIGFVVDESDTPLLASLDASIKVKTIPVQHCMVTTFPWKNAFSYIIGYTKVDPALDTHRKKYGYSKTWAATRHDGEQITYLQPIVKAVTTPE